MPIDQPPMTSTLDILLEFVALLAWLVVGIAALTMVVTLVAVGSVALAIAIIPAGLVYTLIVRPPDDPVTGF